MKKLLLILPVLLMVLLTACSNKDDEEIDGRWELVTKPQGDYQYFWEMNKGKIVVTYTNGVWIDTCASGDYVIKNSVLSVVAPLRQCAESTYDGEWEIQDLDDKYLTVLRYLPRGTIWLEFAKR